MLPNPLANVAVVNLPSCDIQFIVPNSNPFGDQVFPGPWRPWEDIAWFHGTDAGAAAQIAAGRRFNPAAPGGYGKSYGQGNYFAFCQCRAAGYGEFVFKVDLTGKNLLPVTSIETIDPQNLAQRIPSLSVAQHQSLAEELRRSTKPNKSNVVAPWAEQQGFDGLFLRGIDEVCVATVFTAVAAPNDPIQRLNKCTADHSNQIR
ncbi:hypothetical protein [Catellatospora sp. NPDC049133]|jgi:hypothetical protein|uniref:hypothetical protein n=1 Tax=Catellatospora sp. NPDC049133 TaxID=3155499 RepID=UPI003408A591